MLRRRSMGDVPNLAGKPHFVGTRHDVDSAPPGSVVLRDKYIGDLIACDFYAGWYAYETGAVSEKPVLGTENTSFWPDRFLVERYEPLGLIVINANMASKFNDISAGGIAPCCVSLKIFDKYGINLCGTVIGDGSALSGNTLSPAVPLVAAAGTDGAYLGPYEIATPPGWMSASTPFSGLTGIVSTAFQTCDIPLQYNLWDCLGLDTVAMTGYTFTGPVGTTTWAAPANAGSLPLTRHIRFMSPYSVCSDETACEEFRRTGEINTVTDEMLSVMTDIAYNGPYDEFGPFFCGLDRGPAADEVLLSGIDTLASEYERTLQFYYPTLFEMTMFTQNISRMVYNSRTLASVYPKFNNFGYFAFASQLLLWPMTYPVPNYQGTARFAACTAYGVNHQFAAIVHGANNSPIIRIPFFSIY